KHGQCLIIGRECLREAALLRQRIGPLVKRIGSDGLLRSHEAGAAKLAGGESERLHSHMGKNAASRWRVNFRMSNSAEWRRLAASLLFNCSSAAGFCAILIASC